MSFPRYPRYTDSGNAWLGEMPEHWQVAPLKRRFAVTLGKMLQTQSSSADDVPLPYLRAANIQWTGVDISDVKSMWFTPQEAQSLALSAGDLLVSEGGDVGRSCVWAGEILECGFQNSVNRVRPLADDSIRFLYYWMATIKAKGYVDVLCNKSTIAHFTAEKLAAIPVPYPLVGEQRQIACFLDQATAQIDALIAEQQRLLELLKEKRQAVISHAIRQGMDPAVPMTPSGVLWLGDVPAHWEVRSLSSITTKITNGYVGPTRDILVDQGVRYLQSLHIKGNRIRFEVPYFVTEAWSLAHKKSILEAGDVLIVQTGDIGQVAVVPPEFAGCNCHALIVVSPVRERLDGEWLSWCLNSDYGFHTLMSIQTGALHPHLNCGKVKGVMLPVPPLEEQRLIVRRIAREVEELDVLAKEAERAIDLLQERRISLISAAVTGKIDVRGLADVDAEAA